uniref:Uncharacterized protein n=1 Tax=Physcomitrium patens TaxID=3218 RepID=A0A2K1J7T1_PHYPA|nr:hypothetical protein PHYPA_020704 [Physcomitrium patens]
MTLILKVLYNTTGGKLHRNKLMDWLPGQEPAITWVSSLADRVLVFHYLVRGRVLIKAWKDNERNQRDG